MRVTQQTMLDGALRRLRVRQDQLASAQRAVTTGRAVSRASDDPTSASRILSLRADIRARQQSSRSIDDARASVQATDDALAAVTDGLQRVRDLVVAGASQQSQASRDAMASEVAALRDQLVGIANGRHAGRALFGGYGGGDAVVASGTSWTYAGDGGAIERRLDDHETVQVNVTGDQVFGFADGDDLFSRLDGIVTRLRSSDVSGLQADIAGVDAALGRVGQAHAAIGAAGSRIEAAAARNQDAVLGLRGELSMVEDVSMAEAVMELQLQEVAYQATLGALGRTLPPSLVDFLR